MRVRHLIGGEPVESRATFETVDPATQEVLAEVARGTVAEVNAADAAARAAFPNWAARPATEACRADAQTGRPDHAPRARARGDRDARLRPGRAGPARLHAARQRLLEPKNVAVALGSHPIARWGA